jgi:hypothetical protein
MAREPSERSPYTPECKHEAVGLLIESGRPIAQGARAEPVKPDETLGGRSEP